jgi:hypothetical protein
MSDDVLAEILAELRQIKEDVRWFKEREQRKEKANRDVVEQAAQHLAGRSPKN